MICDLSHAFSPSTTHRQNSIIVPATTAYRGHPRTSLRASSQGQIGGTALPAASPESAPGTTAGGTTSAYCLVVSQGSSPAPSAESSSRLDLRLLPGPSQASSSECPPGREVNSMISAGVLFHAERTFNHKAEVNQVNA